MANSQPCRDPGKLPEHQGAAEPFLCCIEAACGEDRRAGRAQHVWEIRQAISDHRAEHTTVGQDEQTGQPANTIMPPPSRAASRHGTQRFGQNYAHRWELRPRPDRQAGDNTAPAHAPSTPTKQRVTSTRDAPGIAATRRQIGRTRSRSRSPKRLVNTGETVDPDPSTSRSSLMPPVIGSQPYDPSLGRTIDSGGMPPLTPEQEQIIASRGNVTVFHWGYWAPTSRSVLDEPVCQVELWQAFASDTFAGTPGICFSVVRDAMDVVSNHRPGGEFRTLDTVKNELGYRYLGIGPETGRVEHWMMEAGTYCYVFPDHPDGVEAKWPIVLGLHGWRLPRIEARLPPHYRGSGNPIRLANQEYPVPIRPILSTRCVVTNKPIPVEGAHLVASKDTTEDLTFPVFGIMPSWFKGPGGMGTWVPTSGSESLDLEQCKHNHFNVINLRLELHKLLDQDHLCIVAKTLASNPTAWGLYTHCLNPQADVWRDWHNRLLLRSQAHPLCYLGKFGAQVTCRLVNRVFKRYDVFNPNMKDTLMVFEPGSTVPMAFDPDRHSFVQSAANYSGEGGAGARTEDTEARTSSEFTGGLDGVASYVEDWLSRVEETLEPDEETSISDKS